MTLLPTPSDVTLATPLREFVRRRPVTCHPDNSIRKAMLLMEAERVGSIIVVDQHRTPLGIFTLRDVLLRVTLAAADLEAPISGVMTPHLVTLDAASPAYEALLLMLRHTIRHVVLLDEGRVVGIISEKDVFTMQRLSLQQLAQSIVHAGSIDDLMALASDVRSLGRDLVRQGAGAGQITHVIASLNDLITRQIVTLEFRNSSIPLDRMCWIALGSEGRFEQTLSTDQDNGIIFSAGADAQVRRTGLLAHADRVNEALARCGFPLCKGNIMARNPQWCLTTSEWQQTFERWMNCGDPEALLNANIFFDLRPIAGNADFALELRQWLLQRTRTNSRFLHQMAGNAMRQKVPLGLLHDFVTDRRPGHEHTLDLKTNGTTLFVDAARIYSLALGVDATNTEARLAALAPLKGVPSAEVGAWSEAFRFLQLLRLRHQQSLSGEQADLANFIDPDELNALERRVLKEALKQARLLQSRLAMDYGV